MKKTITTILALSLLALAMGTGASADVKTGKTDQTRDITLEAEEKDSSAGIKVEELHKNDFTTALSSNNADGVYNIKDRLALSFTSGEDAYLTILDFTAGGSIVQLFPNKWVKDNFVKAGETVSIPAEGSGYYMLVGGPVGVDVVKAIATNNDIQVFDAENKDVAGPFSVIKDPKSATRDILLMAEEPEPEPEVPEPPHPDWETSGDVPPPPAALKWSVASLAVMTKGAEGVPTGFTVGNSGDWRAKLWTNSPSFLVGNRVYVKLLSDKPGKLVSLVNMGASSAENNLLPDGADISFEAGEILILPRNEDKWKLVAAPKAGLDVIKAKLALADGTELELSLDVNVDEEEE
jgi:hypothetical protein